jgi:hypothetical protein
MSAGASGNDSHTGFDRMNLSSTHTANELPLTVSDATNSVPTEVPWHGVRVWKTYLVGSDRGYLVAFTIILLTYVVEAPLRFGLGVLFTDKIIYLRDVASALCVAAAMLSWFQGQGSAYVVVTGGAILMLHTLIGVVTLNTFAQPLFGLKIVAPFLLGLTVAPLLRIRIPQVSTFAGWCFVITAVGVVMNIWVEFPWVGMEFDSPVGKLQLSRQWWSGGGLRLPGFTRASYIAAQIILATLVPLLAAASSAFKRLSLLGLAATVIALTTTKGAWSGLLLLLICDSLTFAGLAHVAGAVLALAFFACLALPIIGVQFGRIGPPVPTWAESFMERLGDMWPRAFDLYDGPVSVVLGRGIGGIGMAQKLGEERIFNAADNLMVFLLVSLGIAGPIYLGWLIVRVAVAVRHVPVALPTRWACGWLAVLLGVGLTTGMIEEPVTNITLGISFGLMFVPRQVAAA